MCPLYALWTFLIKKAYWVFEELSSPLGEKNWFFKTFQKFCESLIGKLFILETKRSDFVWELKHANVAVKLISQKLAVN